MEAYMYFFIQALVAILPTLFLAKVLINLDFIYRI